MTTLVSIVIVNYNRERYLAAAIDSVLKQTYSNFELLIWDDGSTDQSVAIAQQFAQQDKRIRLITAQHQGVTQAAYQAIAQTQGTYLGCVDSDDVLAPTALAKTVEVLEKDAAIGLVYTDYVEMDEASKVTGYGRRCQIPYSQERLLVDFMTFHFRLMRRSTYEQSGGIDPTFSGTAYDYDLCLKLSEVTKVHHLNQPLYFYRRHAESVSNTQAIEQIVWSQRAIEQALQRRGLADHRTIEVKWPSGEFQLRRRTDLAKRLKQTRQAVVCSLLALPLMVAETPLLAQVVPAIDGTGTIVTPNTNQIDVTGGTRSGANLFHSFTQFGVRPEQIVNFESSPALQNILGRVSGGNASVIEGLVRVSGSNANLFLMNPAGIIFGTSARLDVPGSFTATTATGIGFSNQWFNATGANNYTTLIGSPNTFAFTTAQPGVIVNAGNLNTSNGNLTLLGGTVVNTGQLSAPEGQITITSVPGQSVIRLSQVGSLLSLEVMPDRDFSTWTLPIATLPQLLTGGNLSSATGITINPNGTIQLVGSTTPLTTAPGTTLISGQVTAPKIDLFGNQVGLIRANLQASTPTQGGTIRIGGDYQGKGTVPNAAQTFVSSDTQIAANSLLDGDGGRVIIWSNDHTQFLGTIAAQGGKNSGNGGFVEVSGKEALTFKGQVDVSAPKGRIGDLLLDPTTLTIIDAPAGGTFDATAGNIPFGLPDNGANTVSWGAIGALGFGANVSLQASGNLTVNPITGNTPGVTTPGLASLNTANFSLTSTNGSVIFANPNDTIQARGGNVAIAGNTITLGNLDTSFLGSSNSGIITLTANGNITANDIITRGNGYSGGNINITSNAGEINLRNLDASNTNGFGLQNAGTIQITALAGSITANSINASTTKIDPSGDFTGTAGAINLTARNNITVNTDINASAIATNVDGDAGAIAGDVTLTSTNPNPGNNILFGSINTQATSDFGAGILTGGNVQITTNGRIQGTGITATGDTINTQRLTLGIEAPDTSLQGGNISIQQDGGVNNDPFTIGDSALNGTAGSINAGGGATIAAGTFPILPNGGTAAGTPPGVVIISVNTPPTVTTNPLLSANALPNQALPFTFIANTGDINLDNTTVIIDAIVAGTLRRGNIILNVGDVIVVGETLNYTPPNNTVGLVNAFRVRASDRVSDSAPQAIALSIPTPTLTNCTVNCDNNSPGGKLPTPDQITSVNRPLLNPNLTPEDRFTSSFADYLGIFSPERKTEDDGQSLAQKVEKATGVRPAFIYASFVPADLGGTKSGPRPIAAQESDQLELLVITAKGEPLRKRIPEATRANVLRVAEEFRNELINQRNLGTDTYLQLSQQLYKWLIAPIDADLQTRNINNLVFLSDAGLRSTPIAALHDGQRYLVERYSVGLMPSLSLTNTVITDIKDSQLLAMGVSQSTQGQEPLPAVPIELSTLVAKIWRGQLVLNTQTTLQNLKTLRGQQRYGILHMATHASFNPGPVGDSYIQLWDDKLRLDQVRQLGLNDPQVEMMVLSACKTALGNEEAELGFAGLAVLSGVKTTVASLWSVNDAGTAALIIKFYEDLKTAPTKSEALRRAQLAMIKGEVYLKDGQIQGLGAIGGVPLPAASVDTVDGPLSHPYYWSGFTMVGNPW